MSELVPTPFDYSLLSREQAKRTQEAEYRLLGRTQKMIVENGRDLQAVKADIGHGHFLKWIAALGISEKTAENWMNVARSFGEIRTGYEFENHAFYLLSTSTVPESARREAVARAEAGVKITEEVAKSIRDEHQDREAERARRFLEGQLAQTQAEVATLRAQLAEKPQVIEKTVENPETLAHNARLSQQNAQMEVLLKQRTERMKMLTVELRKYTMRSQEQTHHEEVRAKWRQACELFQRGINEGMARMVSPLDAKAAFEPDDWARLAEVVESLERTIESLCGLQESVRSQFVDGSVERRS